MVETVAGVYNSLPPEERQNCNPGAQLRRSGRNRLLRSALRIAQVDQSSSELLPLGTETIHRRKPHPPLDLEDAQRWCGSVDQGPTVAPYYGMEWEHYAILICHNFKPPLAEAWPQLKHWD
jgi:hypothetical protein